MIDKIRLCARSGDNEVFEDLCFFATITEALEAKVPLARLPYLVVVEMSANDVCDILTAARNGNTFSSAFNNMKIIECGKIPDNTEK